MLESEIKTIHSVPDLVDWAGAYSPDGQLLRIVPMFKPGVDTRSKGCILLVDLARDLTLATNYKGGKISTPNIHTLDSHLKLHFGTDLKQFLGKPLGTNNSRLIATHLTKVLRANNLDLSKNIDSNKSRIRFKYIHILSNIKSTDRVGNNLAQFAEWLGVTYTEVQGTLLAK